jgi:outer membrane protein
VRQSEAQVLRGARVCNVGPEVLLDAVIAYTNVLANQSLVGSQRVNVSFCATRWLR